MHSELLTLRHLAFVRDLSPWAVLHPTNPAQILETYRTETWAVSKFFARRTNGCIRLDGTLYIIMLQDAQNYGTLHVLPDTARLTLRFRKLAVDNVGFVLVSIKQSIHAENSNG